MLSSCTNPDWSDWKAPALPTSSLHLFFLVCTGHIAADYLSAMTAVNFSDFSSLLFFTTKLGMMSPLPLQMFFRASKTREHADMSLAALNHLEKRQFEAILTQLLPFV